MIITDTEPSYTQLEKKKLNAIVGDSCDILFLSSIKLFKADCKGEDWIDLESNGILVLVLDFINKTKFLILYDDKTLQQIMKYELYLGFDNYCKQLTETFAYFEIEQGFFGIKFINPNECFLFILTIRKFNDKFTNKIISTLKRGERLHEDDKNFFNNYYRNKIQNHYLKILKEINIDDINKYLKITEASVELLEKIMNEQFNKNKTLSLDISKMKNFNLFQRVKLDRSKKSFNIDEIPNEMKKIFKDNGLKKSDFNTSLEYSLNIFKKFLEKYEKGSSFANFFMRLGISDKDYSKIFDFKNLIRRKKEKLEKQRQLEEEEKKLKAVSQRNSVGSVPMAPKLTIRTSIVSEGNIKVAQELTKYPSKKDESPKKNQKKEESPNKNPFKPQESLSIYDQIQSVKLKKITKEERSKTYIAPPKKNSASLEEAIKMRRIQLTLHDCSEEDECDSDWSES
jgi:hypothetical protein